MTQISTVPIVRKYMEALREAHNCKRFSPSNITRKHHLNNRIWHALQHLGVVQPLDNSRRPRIYHWCGITLHSEDELHNLTIRALEVTRDTDRERRANSKSESKRVKAAWKKVLQALPDEFETSEVVVIGTGLGLSESSISKYLRLEHSVDRVGRGRYVKKNARPVPEHTPAPDRPYAPKVVRPLGPVVTEASPASRRRVRLLWGLVDITL